MRAGAGFMFVLMLLFTMVIEASRAGLPAISSGDFAVVGFTSMCTLQRPIKTCLHALCVDPSACHL